jgi:hypothetical protein
LGKITFIKKEKLYLVCPDCHIEQALRIRFGQAGEAAAGEQFGFEPAPKRFGVGLIVAVAPAAPALHSLMTSH